MEQTIEMLEFIQCLLAKLLKKSLATITPCLLNKTGFQRITFTAEPLELEQLLTALLQPAIDTAKENLVIVMTTQQDHLHLQISIDNTKPPIAQCTSPGKVSCLQAISQRVHPIHLTAYSERLRNAINLLTQYSANLVVSSDVTEANTVTLIEYCDKPVKPAASVKQLAVASLVKENLGPQHKDCLFWPFFDTDILLLVANGNKPRALSVLVADDSIPSKVATQAMLEKLGCRVISASDGTEALAIAQQSLFDLILLDERMPGLNGSDVACQLNQEGQLNYKTPKVSLTGITHPDDIDELFSKGITHYLEKPITKLALEKFLQQWQVTPSPTI